MTGEVVVVFPGVGAGQHLYCASQCGLEVTLFISQPAEFWDHKHVMYGHTQLTLNVRASAARQACLTVLWLMLPCLE